MERVKIPDEMTAEEIQRRWPATVAVLLGRKMACVGCPMALFDTLPDMARTYGIALESLRRELEEAATHGARLPGPEPAN